MSKITTHVLDTERGQPAARITVTLSVKSGDSWTELAQASTNANGRISDFAGASEPLRLGTYRLSFALADYFAAYQRPSFYPEVQLIFLVAKPDEHLHVPLLLSASGYTTYRGS